MIHLVTSTTGLHDATDWLGSDDIVLVAGDALNAVHEVDAIPCRVLAFANDHILFPHVAIDTITPDEWIDLLETSPCRTWS
ncbi:MAG: hypothetical protein ACPF96_05310 [Litorivicinaceae bacterium]